MSKAVLISIRPMWSQKIMSGQKTCRGGRLCPPGRKRCG